MCTKSIVTLLLIGLVVGLIIGFILHNVILRSVEAGRFEIDLSGSSDDHPIKIDLDLDLPVIETCSYITLKVDIRKGEHIGKLGQTEQDPSDN